MIFFSIIVPVYNKSKCLPGFIEEIIAQSFSDFEIILVDDKSTDDSAEIIRAWSIKDERVKGVYSEQNEGILLTRKKGFLASSGQYVWFMDPDDHIFDDKTLEKIYYEVNKLKVDIFHFGTDVKILCKMPEIEKKRLLASVKPYEGRLTGRHIFEEGFEKKSFSFHVWNKVCAREVWNKVFENIPVIRAMMSEDLLMIFLLTYFAESYYGTSKLLGYKYVFGNGISDSSILNLEKIAARATQARVMGALRSFAEKNAPDDEKIKNVVNELELQMLTDSLYVWFHFVKDEEAPKAFEILCSEWGLSAFLPLLYEQYWDRKNEIIKKTYRYKTACDNRSKKAIKTVGILYYRLRNGGVEKVISLLVPMLMSKGYKVVLIMDEPASTDDYYVPENVERVVVDKAEISDSKSYSNRSRQLQNVVIEKGIDAIIYHAWNDPCQFWDMRALQSAGARVFVQTHLVFSSTISWLGEGFNYISYSLASADGIITITSTDYEFWKIYNKNTVKISNPIDEKLLYNDITTAQNNTIIWVARFEDYKRPDDVYAIMQRVTASVPDAKLIMLGTAEKEEDMRRHYKLRKDYKLEEVIEFAGFHKDISEYYKKAKIHLLTSEMEGFSMVLLESKSFGIPTVMYNLDYLDMVRDGRGIRTSAIGDVYGAADNIIALLNDGNVWKNASQKARESFEDMTKENLADLWDELFKAEPKDFTGSTPELTMMELLNKEFWKRENKLLYGGGIRFRTALKYALRGRYWQTKSDIRKMISKILVWRTDE